MGQVEQVDENTNSNFTIDPDPNKQEDQPESVEQPSVEPEVSSEPETTEPSDPPEEVVTAEEPAIKEEPVFVDNPQTTQAQAGDAQQIKPDSEKSNMKLTLTIIIATVVGLIMIGAGYMIFIEQDEPVQQDTANVEPQSTTENENVDTSTVDQDSAEIDAIVNELDDAADFPEDELSDENLQL